MDFHGQCLRPTGPYLAEAEQHEEDYTRTIRHTGIQTSHHPAMPFRASSVLASVASARGYLQTAVDGVHRHCISRYGAPEAKGKAVLAF